MLIVLSGSCCETLEETDLKVVCYHDELHQRHFLWLRLYCAPDLA